MPGGPNLLALPPRSTAIAGGNRQPECSQNAQIVLYQSLGWRIIQLWGDLA